MGKNKTYKTAGGVGGKKTVSQKVRRAMKRYSMFDFIRAVKERALLWNYKDENYYNRLKREKVWNEIARELLTNFEQSKPHEQQAMVEMLQKRWKNSRDSYHRAERLKLRNADERGYIYERELSFLQQCKHDSDRGIESNLDTSGEIPSISPSPKVEMGKKRNTIAATATAAAVTATATAPAPTTGKQIKPRHIITLIECDESKSRGPPHRKRCTSLGSEFSYDAGINVVCQEIEEELQQPSVDENKTSVAAATKDEAQPQRTELEINKDKDNNVRYLPQQHCCIASEPDPDQAFFDSIKPNIRKMRVDQKLDFQIDILKLLKNYSSK